MDDRSALFQTFDKHNLAALGGKYYQDIFIESKIILNILNQTANLIDLNSPTPKEDLERLIKGTVMSKPYSRKNMALTALNAAKNPFLSVSDSINQYLQDEFSKNNPKLFNQLHNLQYDQIKKGIRIQKSKNPEQIKKFVKQTKACINDDPLRFFDQIAKDVGTIYLISSTEKHFENIDLVPKQNANVAYARIYLYQNKSKDEKILAVDNIWFSKNKDKKMINTMVDSLHDIGCYLNLNILNRSITSNFLARKEDHVSVKMLNEDFFKVGDTPIISRYTHAKIPKESNFYEIKHKCD